MRSRVLGLDTAIFFLILFIVGPFFFIHYETIASVFAQEDQDLFSGDPESCSMCHVNVEIKIMKSKTRHMEAGIDCITCHGKSLEHIVNEINEVKPDRVIFRSDTNSFCEECHECSILEEKRLPPKACIDCHDAHAALIPSE